MLCASLAFAQKGERKFIINGIIYQNDSSTVMPYVYLIDTKTGNGTMSDFNGKFTIIAQNSDTLVFQYVGYGRRRYPVSFIKNINDSTKQALKIVMKPIMVNMQPVTVMATKIKPNEIDYMKRYITQHAKPSVISAFQSPITALYNQFSHKGRAERKLQEIFQNILIQEEVNKKFNPEILRQLTEDENIDFDAFRRYAWRIDNNFIMAHEGYDLYAPIMYYYRQYKKSGQQQLPPEQQQPYGQQQPLYQPHKKTQPSPIFYGDE
ncbi:MAG: carboxypeptidase-like regulatory domain-containing protein [Bacteroidetes bacterium]|nr:carboxypeptidase-like regulatory domain-containing protein [Bacteroidota bacterium]